MEIEEMHQSAAHHLIMSVFAHKGTLGNLENKPISTLNVR